MPRQLTNLPFIMMTNPLPTISLPATHHLTPSHTHIPFFNDFFFLISPRKSSTPHSLLLRTFFFFFFYQFSVFWPPIPPSIPLSLSLRVEVISPLDPFIPCLTEELWIPHTSQRGWFQHQAWAFSNFLTLSILVDLRKNKIFLAKNLSLPT